ncbi:DNA-binding response regulator [Alteromonas aestuariivivens]|uniref:DNA-binding response regulator n=1 Tax=Alteromonas aestuariivivens TaxID=1938339 RepID=A0A3D8MAE9_9ALTE|nr:response regulator transcription factor [Alteromonas aestuariivivens]RDV27334.1 DNA-binding response regulator [Alteromonas aestuariivivens]
MAVILVADDHPLFREALTGALSPHFKGTRFLQADSLTSMMAELSSNPGIDLLLLDLSMPGAEGFVGLSSVRQAYPNLPVAVISANEAIETAAQVMNLGAQGFIPKSTPTAEIAEAISLISRKEQWLPQGFRERLREIEHELCDTVQRFRQLTPKQMRVLGYVRRGLMNKQIAHEMNVTEATIKAHISAVLRKLDIRSRTQAVLLMNKHNIDFEPRSGKSA